jgi:hypothetical protein
MLFVQTATGGSQIPTPASDFSTPPTTVFTTIDRQEP